eukprot:4188939-Amphidinium_carterae.2
MKSFNLQSRPKASKVTEDVREERSKPSNEVFIVVLLRGSDPQPPQRKAAEQLPLDQNPNKPQQLTPFLPVEDKGAQVSTFTCARTAYGACHKQTL